MFSSFAGCPPEGIELFVEMLFTSKDLIHVQIHFVFVLDGSVPRETKLAVEACKRNLEPFRRLWGLDCVEILVRSKDDLHTQHCDTDGSTLSQGERDVFLKA